MSLSIFSALSLAASLFLPHALAQGGGIGVAAVRLKGFDKCTDTQKKQIEQSFDDAIDINYYVYNHVDFTQQAEAEFFGPSYLLDQNSQSNIKKVLYQVSTYDRPFPFNPFGQFLHVRCDDWVNKCNGPAAYTVDADKHFAFDNLPNINFCPHFFDKLKDCGSVYKKWLNSPLATDKLHLQNYQCQGKT